MAHKAVSSLNQVMAIILTLFLVPSGIVIATPPSPQTDCTGAILNAPDGGTTISMSGGRLGTAGCLVIVNVTSANPSQYVNTSSSLTSSLPDAAPASANLKDIGKICSGIRS